MVKPLDRIWWLLLCQNVIIRRENLNIDYKIINKFVCQGKLMVTVRINGNVHVMEMWELKRWYGRLHMEKWETGDVA